MPITNKEAKREIAEIMVRMVKSQLSMDCFNIMTTLDMTSEEDGCDIFTMMVWWSELDSDNNVVAREIEIAIKMHGDGKIELPPLPFYPTEIYGVAQFFKKYY